MKKVKINGWEYLFDPATNRLHDGESFTEWGFLTSNERIQVENQLRYGN